MSTTTEAAKSFVRHYMFGHFRFALTGLATAILWTIEIVSIGNQRHRDILTGCLIMTLVGTFCFFVTAVIDALYCLKVGSAEQLGAGPLRVQRVDDGFRVCMTDETNGATIEFLLSDEHARALATELLMEITRSGGTQSNGAAQWSR